jgi:hypothetical protein
MVLCEVDRVRQDVAAFAAGRKGRLRIGIADGLSVQRIARLLEESAHQDPQIEFAIEHRSLAEQLRELRSDLLDVGLASTPAMDPLGSDLELQSIELRKDALVIAMRPDHILAEQAVVRSLEAVTGPFLLVGNPETGAGSIEQLIEPASAADSAVQYVASFDLLFTGVLTGRGVGLLANEQAPPSPNEGMVVRPLGLSRARMTTHLLKRREDLSPVLARFVERAQRIV